MSDKRKHDSPTNTYREICSRVLKLSRNKINPSRKSPKQTQSTRYVGMTPYTRFKGDLQTPKRQARCRYTCLNNSADSPGDGDVLQDIIWDPTSPSPRSGKAPGNAKVIQISDIVNRIAPKDAKPASVDSSLLQWIGESAVPCTPEESLPRARRTLKRKSSVEDLIHLARQFDINMQQGHEEHSTEHINNINNNNRCGEEHKHPVTMTTGVSSAQQVEAELNALFDGPTQRISGRFSQTSSASTCSQEGNGAVSVPAVGGQVTGSEVKGGGETTACATAGIDNEVVGGAKSTATPPKDEDFDDDWEDDDLLNDPFVLEITQNPTGLEMSTCKPSGTLTADGDSTLTADGDSTLTKIPSHFAWEGPGPHSPPLNSGGLAGPWPKPKLSGRSTFMLEPNPCFLVNMSHAKEGSAAPQPGITARNGAPDGPCLASSAAKRTSGPSRDSSGGEAIGVGTAPRQNPVGSSSSGPAPRQTPGPAPRQTPGPAPRQTPVRSTASSPTTDSAFGEISDHDLQSLFDSESLWKDDHGDDDVLLYQVCDNVERVSNSQTMSDEANTARGVGGAGTGSGPVTTGSYIRSSSEPGDRSSTHVNFQGWNIPAKAGNIGVGHHQLVSCSRPSGPEVLDKFTLSRDTRSWGAAGQGSLEIRNFQTGNTKPVMPRTVSARTLANPNTGHALLFKRHLSDSAVCKKAFVTSQVTGKCTAAEIERKKQEAIARRKSRQASLKTP